MAGPWEKYAQTEQGASPWAKYGTSPVSGTRSNGEPQPLTARIAGGALTAPIDPGTEAFASAHPALGVPVRYLSSAGGALMGLPGSIYHSFADPATPEESARYGPSEVSGAKRIGLGVGRLSGLYPMAEGVKAYSDPATRPSLGQAVSVLPEALGQGTGVASGAELGAAGLRGAGSALPYVRPVGEALAKGYAKKLVPNEAIQAYKAVQAAQPGAVGEVLPPDVYRPGYQAPRAYSPGPTAQPIPARPGLMLKGEVAAPPESGALRGVEAPPQLPRGLEKARPLSTVRPKPASAATEGSPYAGVDELRAKLTSPAAMKARAEAKPVAGATSPTERVTEATSVAKVEAPKAKPVEAKPASARREDYLFGEHSTKYDPENLAHRKIKDMTHEELAQAANERKLDGKGDWQKSDFSRSVAEHGKHSTTNAKRVRGLLLDEANMKPVSGGSESDIEMIRRGAVEQPPKAKSLRPPSRLPSPEEETRIQKMMEGRGAAKQAEEKSLLRKKE